MRHPATFFWVEERTTTLPGGGETILTGHDLRPSGARRRGVLRPGPATPRGRDTMLLDRPATFHAHLDLKLWCRREVTLEPGVERDCPWLLLCDDPAYYLSFDGAVTLDPTEAGREQIARAVLPQEASPIPDGEAGVRERILRAHFPDRGTLPVMTSGWSGVMVVGPESPHSGRLIAFSRERARPGHEGEPVILTDSGRAFGWLADAVPPGGRRDGVLLWVEGLPPDRHGSRRVELAGHDLLPLARWSREAAPNELMAVAGWDRIPIRWAEVLHQHGFACGWRWYTFTPEAFPRPPFLLTDDPAYRPAYAGPVRIEAPGAARPHRDWMRRLTGRSAAMVGVWTASWCGVLTVDRASADRGDLLAFARDAGPIAWEEEAILTDDGPGGSLGRLTPT